MLIELALLLAVAAVAFYFHAVRNSEHFARLNVPYLRPTFFLGSTARFVFKRQRPNEFLDGLYNAMPAHKIFGFFMFRTPILFVTDPGVLKQITVKDFEHFVDHRPFIELSESDLFGQSLPMLAGDRWRHMRATLSPAFTGSKMRQMFGLVSQCAAGMAATLAARPAGQLAELDMKDLFAKFANDVIATSAFGICVNSFDNEQNAFLVNGRKMMNANNWRTGLKMLAMTLLPWFTRLTRMQMMDGDTVRFFERMVVDTMETRRREQICRPDLIELLMQLRKDGHIADDAPTSGADGFAAVTEGELVAAGGAAEKRTLTDQQIVAQCFLFFAAGFDTVSTTLASLSYELAVNAHVQQRLHEECAAVRRRLAGDQSVSYELVQEMPYLDQVVSELLRMWPPAMFSERMCVKPYAYDDGELRFEMPTGSSVWLPIYSLQHDEKYWTDPERFDPERFGVERKADIVPGAYVPFGLGPRSCIASRFALMEIKAAIYHLVLMFRFEPCVKTQIPLLLAKSPAGVLTEKGIHLTMTLRE